MGDEHDDTQSVREQQTWSCTLTGIEREGWGCRMVYKTESVLCQILDTGGPTATSVARLRA